MQNSIPKSTARRGVAVVFTAVTVTLLIGFAALAIDVGHMYSVQAELQKTADASVLAGATQLHDYPEIIDIAQAYAKRNYPNNGMVLAASDIEVGNWSQSSSTFAAGAIPSNAVRVLARRAEVNSNPVQMFFASILGISQANLGARAVALVGGARCAGIWGLEGITGSGDISTDSYRSDDGSYGGGNVYANGDLCSNQDIALEGDVSIWGDVMHGPGYGLSVSGKSYYISGDRRELCCQVQAPKFDIYEIIANNDNDSIGLTDRNRDPFAGNPWNLVVTGNDNLTLAPGTYYFNSVLIDGGSTLTTTGLTKIYITGIAAFTGNGVANLTQVPENLQIFSTGPTLSLDGTAGFYGAVIAPTTDIILAGTGEYYGTILGRTVDADGTSTIHVDESLIADLFDIDSVTPIMVQ